MEGSVTWPFSGKSFSSKCTNTWQDQDQAAPPGDFRAWFNNSIKGGEKEKKAGPERRKVLQVATMKESSYTSLIPQKKVLRTLYALTTYTKEKTAHAFYIRHQHLVPTAHFKMSCSLSMKPRKIILLANITKDSMLDWKDSYALRWEQRFNLPLSQNQFFFLYQDIDTLHKNIQSSSEKKHKVKTKLSLLP